MALQQGQMYCATCQRPTLATRNAGINHVLHLLITVLLCGCWAPVWLLLAIGSDPPWRCSFCGSLAAARAPANTSRTVVDRATDQWWLVAAAVVLAICGGMFFLMVAATML